MNITPLRARTLALATGCVALGAGAGAIANAGAATHAAAHPATAHHAAAHHARPGARLRRLRKLAGGAVEGSVVVPTNKGTSFATVTFNRGKVASVSGQQLTITEGSAKATYKTVTLSVPTSAKVRNNGTSAALSSLTAGERVVVLDGVKKEWVVAHTAKTAS